MRPTAILATTYCFLLVFTVAIAQMSTEARQGKPLYSQVVDKAFRFSEGIPAEFQAFESRIVIRYLPAFGATESQIVALRERSGTYRVIRYGIKPGTRPLSEQYNEVLRHKPSATADDILRGFNVEITEQEIKNSTVQLLNGLDSLTIPTKLSPDLCMDGMTYELWIQTPSNEIHATLSDCAYGKGTHSAAIVRWIRAIGAELQEHAPQAVAPRPNQRP